jgi:hypothetical protein
LTAEKFGRSANGDINLKVPLQLSRGRYLFRARFSAQGRDNEIFVGIKVDGEVVFRYHTNTAFMADSYRDWVVHLERPGKVAPYLRFIVGRDDTLRWDGSRCFGFLLSMELRGESLIEERPIPNLARNATGEQGTWRNQHANLVPQRLGPRNATDIKNIRVLKEVCGLTCKEAPRILTAFKLNQFVGRMKEVKNILYATCPPRLPKLKANIWVRSPDDRFSPLNCFPFSALDIDFNEKRVRLV